MNTDTANTSLSELEFQMKQYKRQYDEARQIFNQRKIRVSMMLDCWMRNQPNFGQDVKHYTKLEKLLWEKLNIGVSIHIILKQIDDFYEEIIKNA